MKGAENYAEGWIKCFHAYQGLGPPETHWSLEDFQKYSPERFEKDMFEDGHVDVAVFQPTYLKEWYASGFNTTENDAEMAARHPDRLIVNGRWDARDGEAGLRQLEEDHARYGLKGVKLYTAEWKDGSRGWTLKDPEAAPFFEKCIELGITNIHVHKGPTIWPLDKDAFDVSDVDQAATRYQELNFIVEHVGLPRIEDFCFMATQEPNVYAGLSVVVGALMHARPRFFAKVMGELMFWVGEDKMLFGADYAIWEPKWQVEGLVDWDYPDETLLGLPGVHDGVEEEDPRAQRGEALRRRGPAGAPAFHTGTRRPPATTPSWSRAARDRPRARPRRARDRLRSRARRADHVAEVRDLVRRVGGRGRRRPAAAADAAVRAELRVPHGRRRARCRAPAA